MIAALPPVRADSGTANRIGSSRLFGPAVATLGASAVAYVADANGKLTAVSDNGTVLWHVPNQTCLAAGRDGLIYGVSGDTVLLTIKVG